MLRKMLPHEHFHAKELLGELRGLHTGSAEVDGRISRFMNWQGIQQVTWSLDHAALLLKPNRQFGLRPTNPTLESCGFLPEEGKHYWVAFTEVATDGGNEHWRSLIWGYPSQSQPVALAQVGLMARIIEDAPL